MYKPKRISAFVFVRSVGIFGSFQPNMTTSMPARKVKKKVAVYHAINTQTINIFFSHRNSLAWLPRSLQRSDHQSQE